VAGGTWLCINTLRGRAAFLTNFREVGCEASEARDVGCMGCEHV